MNFSKIDALAAELQSKRPLNPGELKRLREEFTIEHTYHSNAIEGNTLTLRETALILQEGITIAEKPIREHLEVIGYKDAFEYILSLADSETQLTETVIRQVHSLVLMDNAANRGMYRNVPVRILGASHEPPQPYLVAPQMEALLLDYAERKQSHHIIEAAAEFHLRFEGIHPFIDGNGRTSRLLLNFELMKAGLLPVNIKFSDRRKYYDCFDAYYGSCPSMEPLAGLIAGYEQEALQHYLDILAAN